jgi:hypothetical protein
MIYKNKKTKLFYPIPKKLGEELESFKEVEKHRKLDCLFYDSCLSHAFAFFWKGFSCLNCEYYIEDPNYIKDNDKFIEIFKYIGEKKNDV